MYAVYLAYSLGFGILFLFIAFAIGDYRKNSRALTRAKDEEKT